VVGAGFPSAAATGPSRYVPGDAADLELEGGSWGPGRLVRSPTGQWRWRVKVRIDPYASSDRTIWTAGPEKMDLRLRLALRIPCVLDDVRIDSAGRRRLRAALEEHSAAELVDALARGRVDARVGEGWALASEGDGRNDGWGATYIYVLTGRRDQPCLAGRVLLGVPASPQDGSLLSLIDVRVDFDAMTPPSDEHPDGTVDPALRLTLAEIRQFFSHAWHLTTTVLPLAVTHNPYELPPAGPPRAEFYLSSERHPNMGGGDRTLLLQDMVDLTPLGPTTRTQIADLAVRLTAPLDLTPDETASTLRSALLRMAEDQGFLDADAADW
jgi:hypothetical protein